MQNSFLNFLIIFGLTKWGKFRIFCEEILYLLTQKTANLKKRKSIVTLILRKPFDHDAKGG